MEDASLAISSYIPILYAFKRTIARPKAQWPCGRGEGTKCQNRLSGSSCIIWSTSQFQSLSLSTNSTKLQELNAFLSEEQTLAGRCEHEAMSEGPVLRLLG